MGGTGFIDYNHRCNVRNLVVTSENDTITTVNNNIFDQVEFDKAVSTNRFFINSFYVEHQTVIFIPRGLFNFFPKLQEICVHDSKLKSVTKADIEQFTELRVLQLSKNELKRLDGGLLQSNRELRAVNFYGNQLKFIGKHLLDNLDKLVWVSFYDNECTSEMVSGKDRVAGIMSEIATTCETEENHT